MATILSQPQCDMVSGNKFGNRQLCAAWEHHAITQTNVDISLTGLFHRKGKATDLFENYTFKITISFIFHDQWVNSLWPSYAIWQ